MGYTHYWKKSTGATTAEWESMTKAAEAIIAASPVPIAYESDCDEQPLVDEDTIRFNGVGDDGHETFMLVKKPVKFEFCKTARKDYDVVVVAMLFAAAEHLSGFSWSSDGDPKEHEAGKRLFETATGR